MDELFLIFMPRDQPRFPNVALRESKRIDDVVLISRAESRACRLVADHVAVRKPLPTIALLTGGDVALGRQRVGSSRSRRSILRKFAVPLHVSGRQRSALRFKEFKEPTGRLLHLHEEEV
jgi:hypothetical protein